MRSGRGKDGATFFSEEEPENDTRKTEFCRVPNILVNAEVSQLILAENLFQGLMSKVRKF